MRISRPALLLFLCCLIPASLLAQQPASATPTTSGPQSSQAASILQQSIAAMTGGAPVTDVTMTGTVTLNHGSTTESGTVTLVGTTVGQGQSTITMPSGTRTEVRDISKGWPTLTVTGPDGVTSAITTQSALSPHPTLFFPPFVLASAISSPIYASSYVGQETQNGEAVLHFSVWLVPGSNWPASPQLLQQISQHDIYLDAGSLLPVVISFAVHPFDPADPNKPILPYRGNSADGVERIEYSDYRRVAGRMVAFHTHTTISLNSLIITDDGQLSSVNFNTGATVATN